jgi:hypothetical protein
MPIPYWYIDTGFTALLILLAAVDEGLGAVSFGSPDIADFRARFGVPDEWTPIGAAVPREATAGASWHQLYCPAWCFTHGLRWCFTLLA